MPKRPRRLRRCQLSVPGSNERMIEKAAGLEVDYVFLDLEDAVAPSAKRQARGKVVAALNGLDWGKTVRSVRVNDLTTEYAHEDIIEVVEGAGANLDVIIVPKVLSAADVLFADKLLSMIEKKLGLARPIGLEVLIEEVEAMMRVEEIAAASPRLEALIFGMGDYSASQHVDMGEFMGRGIYPGDIWNYQRHKLIIAARSHGLAPVDGPFPDFRNPERYRTECERAKVLGCVGKWAIHPAQIEIAQEVFSPTAEEIARARAMRAAFDEALANGLGAVQFEGQMIDIAAMRFVNNVLDRAGLT
jgi:citrate lyase subunit beta/citryl-CoA lyase